MTPVLACYPRAMAPNSASNAAVLWTTWLAGHAPGTLNDATADEHRGYMAISLASPKRFLQLMSTTNTTIRSIRRRLDTRRLRQRNRNFAGEFCGRRVRRPAWRARVSRAELYAAIGDWAKSARLP